MRGGGREIVTRGTREAQIFACDSEACTARSATLLETHRAIIIEAVDADPTGWSGGLAIVNLAA
jgi:hypothetical protein